MADRTIAGDYTGQTYTIHTWDTDERTEQFFRQHRGFAPGWSYTNERGHGPGLNGASWLVSAEEAIAAAQAADQHQAAQGDNSPLSRDEYETAAEQLGLPTLPDTEIQYLFVPAQNAAAAALAVRRRFALPRPTAPVSPELVTDSLPAGFREYHEAE